MTDNRRLLSVNMLALALPLALILGALGSQYIGGLYPCEMCLWQRWPHYVAIGLAVAALVVRPARRALVPIAAVAVLVSGAIGVFHAGVEYRWWQGITTCAAPSGGGLTDIMAAPMVRCDVPAWTLAGISLAGFNALFSLGGGALILALWAKKR